MVAPKGNVTEPYTGITVTEYRINDDEQTTPSASGGTDETKPGPILLSVPVQRKSGEALYGVSWPLAARRAKQFGPQIAWIGRAVDKVGRKMANGVLTLFIGFAPKMHDAPGGGGWVQEVLRSGAGESQ